MRWALGRALLLAVFAIAVPACQAAPRVAPEPAAPPSHPGFAELFHDTGLVATPDEERARWVAATAGELARSVERIAGVADARVHLALPERPALDADPQPAKAAVLIRRKPGVATIDEEAVRALLAGAIAGLPQERVTVVQVAAAPAPGPAASASLVSVGPIRVTRGSAIALKAVLGTTLLLNAALAVGLVLLVRARRSAA